MFHKKKFKLVEKKSEKEMHSEKNKWIRYLIILGLIGFVLLIILANVKSKSYYQNLKVQKTQTETETQTISAVRSILFSNEISPRTIQCSIISCSVSCSGDMSDLKTYLQSKQKSCNSMTLSISNYFFPDDQLQSNWLEGTFNLSVIRISTGTLKSIAEGAFNQITVKYVTILELSDVQLQILTENTFIGLNSLTEFILKNSVETFEADGFLKPMDKTLKKITIKTETLNAVDPTPWLRGDFKNLMTIVFDGSNLGGNIRHDTLQHLTELSILTMNSCKISNLPNGVFDFMMKHMVVYISLQKNKLKNLSGNYLKKIGSLKSLDIQNNPWHCSCELNELVNEYQRYPDGFGANVKCSSPLSYANQSFSHITTPLSCDDPTSTTNAITTSTASVTTTTSTSPAEESPSTFLIVSDSSPITSKSTTEETTFRWSSIPSTSSSSETPITLDSTEVIHSTSIITSSTDNTEQGSEESTVSPSSALTDDGIHSTSTTTSSTGNTEKDYEESTVSSSSALTEDGIHSTSITTSSTDNTEQDYEDSTVRSSSALTDDGITLPLPHTTPSPQNRTTTLSANTIFIECQRYKPNRAYLTEAYIEVTAPLASFTITYLSATSVKLIMEESIDDLALIWFYDQPHINGSGNDIRIIGEFKVGCQSDVENSLTIEGLLDKRAYTFCLVQEGQEVISPFSCRSYFTSEDENEGMSSSDIWLKTEDKALTIGLFVFGILISLSLGALTIYFIIRAHPVLLKGSKRVVIVNRSTGDVLIMPKPNEKPPLNESSFRNSFETNTTIPQRRSSETSIQSGLSYMLANNYEDIEYRWKMNVVNDLIYANRIPKSPPPPLPKRTSETSAFNKEYTYCKNIDISVINTKENDYGYIP